MSATAVAPQDVVDDELSTTTPGADRAPVSDGSSAVPPPASTAVTSVVDPCPEDVQEALPPQLGGA